MVRKWIVDRMADVWRLHAKLQIRMIAAGKDSRNHALQIILIISWFISLIFARLWWYSASIMAMILLGQKPYEYLENLENEICEELVSVF